MSSRGFIAGIIFTIFILSAVIFGGIYFFADSFFGSEEVNFCRDLNFSEQAQCCEDLNQDFNSDCEGEWLFNSSLDECGFVCDE